ncbi:hypothetical protein EST38_g8449 [Candolleomyces aberdarensis]|uniref:SH3 domain-containing protein n=1 Tax=Candolleomyces aberdarensis TaxID=2316362 RepID=A0A4Q2DCN5_9AGAR|nr:hypothetical protein EST38_g8449 [Candolleomyces aberdarensis]
MKLNSPLPQPLPKECAKAAKIFKSFVDGANNGLDGVIPRSILVQAKGFAIFSVFKAGFLFSARAGSGVVIAKLDDGSWSAPSAIGTAGLGVGGQLGAEVTDFLVVLNSRSAVRSFMAAGSVNLGGGMSVALGPMGRHGEATGAVNTNGKLAAMYETRILAFHHFRHSQILRNTEGSVIVEREDANYQAYDSPVTAKMLLGGTVDPPEWAMPLIKTLEACTGMPGSRGWIQDGASSPSSPYSFGSGVGSGGITPQQSGSSVSSSPSFLRRKKKPEFPPASWGAPSQSGSYFTERPSQAPPRGSDFGTTSQSRASFKTQFDSDYNPVPTFVSKARIHDDTIPAYDEDPLVASTARKSHMRSTSLFTPPQSSSSKDFKRSSLAFPEPDLISLNDPNPFTSHTRTSSLSTGRQYSYDSQDFPRTRSQPDSAVQAVALYKFDAVESGDLSFDKGDVISIVKKSDSTDDWWTGKVHGREGIFPANFVELV